MTEAARVPPFEQRVSAIEQLGYTRREAEFLVSTALHSGYFLRRQFSDRGKANAALCLKLTSRNHGKLAQSAGHAHVYHISGKGFYRALGQVDNRHRRNHESFYIRSKLMLLDYVLATGQAGQFLATEADKLDYFCRTRGLATSVLPSKKYVGRDGSKTTRFFVDKYPVKVDPNSGSISFGFVNDGATNAGFSTWLTQIRPLIDALGAAQIVFISLSVDSLSWAKAEFARRFGGASGQLEAYFRMRRELEARGLIGHSQEALDRYRSWHRQYTGEAYERQYSAWRQSGEAVAGRPGGVTLATHLLPFRYGMFGQVGAGNASNIGLRDGSDEIEGGCICFVATRDQKFVRIGFSPHVIRRMSDIRRDDFAAVNETAEHASLLGTIPGTPATERWIHRQFSADHAGKKWFHLSEKLRAFLRASGLSDRCDEPEFQGGASGLEGVSAQ